MKNPNKNTNLVNNTLHILGILTCILPPAICTAMYFPLWKDGGGEAALAGGGVFLLVICAMPLFKWLRRALTYETSFVMWLMIFLMFFFTAKIAHQMTVISFVGFISNLVGAVIIKRARRKNKNERRT